MKHSKTFFLLQPNCLSWNYKTNEFEDTLRTGLNLLQQALNESSYERSLITVNKALEILGSVEIIETEDIHTNNFLKPWEVKDYDQFFGLKHVQAKNPAKCLVVSLLKAYQVWLELNCCTSLKLTKSVKELESKKTGFKNCVSLFSRALNLRLEEIP